MSLSGVTPGYHQIRLTAKPCSALESTASLSYAWSLYPNFIEIMGTVSGPNVLLQDQLFVSVDELGTSALLQFQIPLAPDPNELVAVHCACNDTRQATISPTSFSFDASSYLTPPPLNVTGVTSYDNTQGPYKPFSVSCSVSSKSKTSNVDTSFFRYLNGSVRSVYGECAALMWPCFQDVLVLSETGSWASSLTNEGAFDLTLSSNTTAIFVGDVVFRSKGRHFGWDTAVSVGGIPTSVVNYTADVRPLLHSLNHPWYMRNVDWSQPIDGLTVLFPSYNASCLNATTGVDECTSGEIEDAEKALLLSNPGGANISCPELCPGYGATTGPGGAFYTPVCVNGYSSGSVCLDPATAGKCAWGLGDACRLCPTGAICPGGFRMWCAPSYSMDLV